MKTKQQKRVIGIIAAIAFNKVSEVSKKKQVEEEIKSAMENALTDEEKEIETKKQEAANEKDQKVKELTDALQRLQAEFINYKNRTEKESKLLVEYANSELIKKMLPVLDSFEIALKNSQDTAKFKQGMEMLHAQFLDVLKQEGLNRIEAEGKKFDPYKHEVLLKQNSEHDEDTVIDELQKGYQVKDRVIRHSKVKISAGKKE